MSCQARSKAVASTFQSIGAVRRPSGEQLMNIRHWDLLSNAVVHARARTSIGMFTEDGGSGSAEPASNSWTGL